MKTKKQAVVKITGDQPLVVEILKKIETAFPLYVEGKLKENNPEPGVHVFLTLIVEAEEKGGF